MSKGAGKFAIHGPLLHRHSLSLAIHNRPLARYPSPVMNRRSQAIRP
jgi:hypothetical protein